MKRTIVLLTSITALLMFAAVTSAGAATRIRVNIPFDFFVGEQQLAAGSYVFEMRGLGFGSSSSSAVAIYRPDGNFACLTLTMPAEYDRRSSDGHLHFRRYENTYFLYKVEGPQSGAGVRMTKAEREYKAQARRPQGVVLIAVKQSLSAGASDRSQSQSRPRLILQQSDALR